MYLKFSSSHIFPLFLNETIFTAVEALRFRFPDKWNLESERVTATPGAQASCFLTNRSTFIMGGIGQPRSLVFCNIIISGYMSQWYFPWFARQSISFGIFFGILSRDLAVYHSADCTITSKLLPSITYLHLSPLQLFIFLSFCSLEKQVFFFVLESFLCFCMNFLADSIMCCWR